MEKFQARMKCDENWTEIEAYDHEEAAENFAEYAYHQLECHSLGDEWRERYSIVVQDGAGKESCWNIAVEYEPKFHAFEWSKQEYSNDSNKTR